MEVKPETRSLSAPSTVVSAAPRQKRRIARALALALAVGLTAGGVSALASPIAPAFADATVGYNNSGQACGTATSGKLEWTGATECRWQVPAGVTTLSYNIAGGAGGAQQGNDGAPGYGEQAWGTMPVTPGQIVSLWAGQQGGALTGSQSGTAGGAGWSNGGAGGGAGWSTANGGAGGGGSSAIYIDGSVRRVVSGGGGGGGSSASNVSGGAGGDGRGNGWGSKGGNGTGTGGAGGQPGGASSGNGGNGQASTGTAGGGGGGGAGWTGGLGGKASDGYSGGGGGGTAWGQLDSTKVAESHDGPAGGAWNGWATITYNIAPKVTLTLNPASAVIGQTTSAVINVVDPATNVAVGGTYQLYDSNNTLLGSGTLTNGTATVNSIPSQPVGSLNYKVKIAPSNTTYLAAEQTATLPVAKGNTNTTVDLTSQAGSTGQTVAVTATVSVVSPAQATATGQVTFYRSITTVKNPATDTVLGQASVVSGQASIDAANFVSGGNYVYAVYAGNASLNSSTVQTPKLLNFTKGSTNATLTLASQATGVRGSSLNASVHVAPQTAPGPGTPAPAGTVDLFIDGGLVIDDAAINASGDVTASLPLSLPIGNAYKVTAKYNGDDNWFSANSSEVNLAVTRAPSAVSLVLSKTQFTRGDSAATVTATVAPATSGSLVNDLTGSVEFFSDGESLGAVPVDPISLTAVLTLPRSIAAGAHDITASYSGDTNWGTSDTTAATQTTVDQADTQTAVTLSESAIGQGADVSATATVEPVDGVEAPNDATGTVDFFVNGDPFTGSAGVSLDTTTHTATVSLPTSLAIGNYVITAKYSGDTNWKNSDSDAKQLTVSKSGPVTAATPTISGTVKGGAKLTAKPGTWAPNGVAFAYQWLRDGKNISGATSDTYTVALADITHKLSVKVTGSKNGYTAVSKTSEAVSVPVTYKDVPATFTHFLGIEWMALNGYATSGPQVPNYNPKNATTRAAMATMLMRIYETDKNWKPSAATVKNWPYSDVKTTDTQYRGIAWMYEHGYAVSAVKYNPTAPVTRGAMASFLQRINEPGYHVKTSKTLTDFTDVKTTDTFYKAIAWMAENGYAAPAPKYNTNSSTTRGAMATFLYRIMK